MDTVESTRPLSATASSQHRRTGISLMLASSVSNQTGVALGASAFPAIGPVGVVAIRQAITAMVLIPVVHPRFRGLSRAQWLPILGLALVFNVMNLTLYLAIERIGLGLAVTLEFLGPLTVAILASRRLLDLLCALMAVTGVVVLTNPGPSTDVLGISLALIAAVSWGCYILINRTLGQRLPGLQGTAIASLLTAIIWLPIGAIWFVVHPPALAAIGLAIACGLLSSIVPFVADLQALRRVPAGMFGIFTSLNPVWAAFAGWLVLHQMLQINEWVGIVLIIASSITVSATAARRKNVSITSSRTYDDLKQR